MNDDAPANTATQQNVSNDDIPQTSSEQAKADSETITLTRRQLGDRLRRARLSCEQKILATLGCDADTSLQDFARHISSLEASRQELMQTHQASLSEAGSRISRLEEALEDKEGRLRELTAEFEAERQQIQTTEQQRRIHNALQQALLDNGLLNSDNALVSALDLLHARASFALDHDNQVVVSGLQGNSRDSSKEMPSLQQFVQAFLDEHPFLLAAAGNLGSGVEPGSFSFAGQYGSDHEIRLATGAQTNRSKRLEVGYRLAGSG